MWHLQPVLYILSSDSSNPAVACGRLRRFFFNNFKSHVMSFIARSCHVRMVRVWTRLHTRTRVRTYKLRRINIHRCRYVCVRDRYDLSFISESLLMHAHTSYVFSAWARLVCDLGSLKLFFSTSEPRPPFFFFLGY